MATKNVVELNGYKFVIGGDGKLRPDIKSNLKGLDVITKTTKEVAMGMTAGKSAGKTL